MHLADMDYLAFRGESLWHRASAPSKIFFTLAVIAGVVAAQSPVLLASILVLQLGLLQTAGVPLRRFGHLLFYPAFFAGLFALSCPASSWAATFTVVIKSLTAASSLLLLAATTGAPVVFGCLRLFLPAVIADALFLTYRSFFILSGRLGNFLTALKVKGGYSPAKILLNLRSAAGALGVLLIYSLEASERMDKVLALRGYRAGIFLSGSWYRPTKYDLGPALAGLAVLIGVVML
ncbi:energy-coupling factor transporter transmembrane component T [Moorellaceae bacterium AZ2]